MDCKGVFPADWQKTPMVNHATYLRIMMHIFYTKNDDDEKCRYLNVTNYIIVSYNSFKLVPHEVL